MPSPITPVLRTITIVAIQQKTTQKGRDMWTITDEKDDFYSVFDDSVRARIAEGQTVALMVKEEPRGGKTYKNIVGLAEAGAPIPVSSPAGPAAVSYLLPGPTPPMSQPVQHPAPNPAPRQAAAGALPMVDIRHKALALAVSLYAAGRITEKQIEPNANEFVSYMLGEQQSSSGGADEFVS